jgi:Ca-activated chloride channel family protein
VSNVRVDAQVTRGTELVTGLTKDDFRVFDNDVQQNIVYFGRDREPLSLLILLDVSGSMRKYVEQVATTARQSLRYLRVGDKVGVMVFGRTSHVRKDLTTDFTAVTDEIRAAVGDESVGAATAINDALLDGAKYLEEHAGEKDRRSILILTDNLGLSYKNPDSQVIQALYSADTVLNSIVVGKAERPDPVPAGVYVNPDYTPFNVFKISEETGGEWVKAEKAGQAFDQMIERIRTRYSLHYNMPADAKTGAFRRIRVELTPDAKLRFQGAELHARKGYFVK